MNFFFNVVMEDKVFIFNMTIKSCSAFIKIIGTAFLCVVFKLVFIVKL